MFRLLIVFSMLSVFPIVGEAQKNEADEILAVVRAMFDGLAARDTAMMRQTLDPDARLVQTFSADGVPGSRSVSMTDFLSRIAQDGPPIEERFWDPQIVVHDNLASIWISYAFFVNGEMSHCGEDNFQLARGSNGWKIIALADTQRREGCVPQ